jgi:hypothetical protein
MREFQVKVSVDTKEPASEEYNFSSNSAWRAIYNSLNDFKGNFKEDFRTITIEVSKGAEVVKASKEKEAKVEEATETEPVATEK